MLIPVVQVSCVDWLSVLESVGLADFEFYFEGFSWGDAVFTMVAKEDVEEELASSEAAPWRRGGGGGEGSLEKVILLCMALRGLPAGTLIRFDG